VYAKQGIRVRTAKRLGASQRAEKAEIVRFFKVKTKINHGDTERTEFLREKRD
jgi:hypothetical protein